jgi:hypothetical protein
MPNIRKLMDFWLMSKAKVKEKEEVENSKETAFTAENLDTANMNAGRRTRRCRLRGGKQEEKDMVVTKEKEKGLNHGIKGKDMSHGIKEELEKAMADGTLTVARGDRKDLRETLGAKARVREACTC